MSELESVSPKFIEIGEHEKGFAKHFETKIAPLLNGIESNRLLQYAKFKKRLCIGVPIIILLLIGAVLLERNFKNQQGIFLDIGFFFILGTAGFVYEPILRYQEDLKSKFLPIICKFYGNMNYELYGESNVEDKYSDQIFPSFTEKRLEDFISGEYKNVVMKLHETKLIRRRKKRSTITVFHGLVIELDFPKPFKGKTLLCQDEGRVGNFLTGKEIHGLKRVELEDPEFEAIFQVFSSDQVEARFVLTTAFMERLLNLAKLRSPKGDPLVQCAFEDKQMVIAIRARKNLFEPGSIKKSALQMEDIHTFLAEMKQICELIDVLKLTRR